MIHQHRVLICFIKPFEDPLCVSNYYILRADSRQSERADDTSVCYLLHLPFGENHIGWQAILGQSGMTTGKEEHLAHRQADQLCQ